MFIKKENEIQNIKSKDEEWQNSRLKEFSSQLIFNQSENIKFTDLQSQREEDESGSEQTNIENHLKIGVQFG